MLSEASGRPRDADVVVYEVLAQNQAGLEETQVATVVRLMILTQPSRLPVTTKRMIQM